MSPRNHQIQKPVSGSDICSWGLYRAGADGVSFHANQSRQLGPVSGWAWDAEQGDTAARTPAYHLLPGHSQAS